MCYLMILGDVHRNPALRLENRPVNHLVTQRPQFELQQQHTFSRLLSIVYLLCVCWAVNADFGFGRRRRRSNLCAGLVSCVPGRAGGLGGRDGEGATAGAGVRAINRYVIAEKPSWRSACSPPSI